MKGKRQKSVSASVTAQVETHIVGGPFGQVVLQLRVELFHQFYCQSLRRQ